MNEDYKCDYCGKEIKPKGNKKVCLSQGNLLCSQECVDNFYDINWISTNDLPDIMPSG